MVPRDHLLRKIDAAIDSGFVKGGTGYWFLGFGLGDSAPDASTISQKSAEEANRAAHGKKPLKPQYPGELEKEVKESTTDPQSG